MKIPLIDLQLAYEQWRDELDSAVSEVLTSGWYILGEQVRQFEQEFADYCRVPHAVGVASGTDAILLALKALGVGAGDEVITVAQTAVATVAAIELAGAKPVFVDVDPITYTIDPFMIEQAITPQTKLIVPVHLYGHPADMEMILDIARQHKLKVLEDCAQAHGAKFNGQPVGSLGDAGAFSFYPTKNLGAMGDGGAIVTRHPEVADRLQLLRQYGWRERYISEITGYNSRLDELQAAILRVRLRHLEEENMARRMGAQLYRQLLANSPITRPQEMPNYQHVYHLFVIQVEHRDALQAFLQEQEIGTAVHYPVSVHLQPAYQHLGYAPGSLPVTERLAERVLSLPMHPLLAEEEIKTVAKTIKQFYSQ